MKAANTSKIPARNIRHIGRAPRATEPVHITGDVDAPYPYATEPVHIGPPDDDSDYDRAADGRIIVHSQRVRPR